jgi:hypothetical protein
VGEWPVDAAKPVDALKEAFSPFQVIPNSPSSLRSKNNPRR